MTLAETDRVVVDSCLNNRRIRSMVAVAVLASVVLLAGLLVVAVHLLRGGTASGSPSSRGVNGVPGRTAPALGAAQSAGQRSSALTLPQATGYVGGVPVGFPNNQAGAVAAAYGYSRIATGLDVQGTLQTVASLADPTSDWFGRSRAQMADALVAQRKELGLAASGPDTGAVLNVSPSGYQIQGPLAAGRTTVLTLDVISGQSTSGAITSGGIVLRWALRWDGNRWLVAELFADNHDDQLAAVPFTSDAVAKGWREATGG